MKRLLVANRGEIARRVFRTAHAMGIETVAVFSDGDADAPFVDEADIAVALGGRTAAESYLDAEKVLAAARRANADAVHPGYGFLSENADFARAVVDAGMVWVGPPPEAIAMMGDKLEAKKLMVAAGVPTLPSVEITDGLDVAGEASAIGFPVLIKAAAGGGGKGMRVVPTADDLTDAIAGAKREALNSFGNDTVFLEKYLPAPRHVEIQVLGDTHGNLVHCFERECSIQRRHQKVVEEAPSTAVDDELRARMGAVGVEAVAAIGYYSAGTVEFLLDDTSGEFFFLEVNTRLQVEHPVTEEITGLDLVRQMIRVAEGHQLDFTQSDLTIDGHAIEVRLYAEDPANDFLPAIGDITAWQLPNEPSARFDSGVESGSVVSVDFDPMLAKVVVHAPTRTEAAQRLALVLERMVIAGVVTNRDFLVSTLRSAEFLAGDTHTDFITKVAPATRFAPSNEQMSQALAVAVLCRQAHNRAEAPQLSFMRSGYRNSIMPPQEIRFVSDERELPVAYRSLRDGDFDIWVNDVPTDHVVPVRARLVDCRGTQIVAEIDGLRSTYDVIRSGVGETDVQWLVQGPWGAIEVTELPRFPEIGREGVAGGQVAPMPGAIRVVAVAVGDLVLPGQTLVVMEAMKMEHTLAAPTAAVVSEVRCEVGDQVDNGQVLIVLQESDD
jgi:propionyl-CoA carboxylase alpha chain